VCAHAVRVAVKKIDGIDSVQVSLNRGVVVIRLKPENRVTLEQLREAIRRNGFTPKEADVRARGTVVQDSGHLALALPGIGAAFRLTVDSQAPATIGELERVRGQVVTLEGRVRETARWATALPSLEAHAISKDAAR